MKQTLHDAAAKLTQARPWSPITGCPCGHVHDEDCVRHQPLALGRDDCCTVGGFEFLEACRVRGITCGPGRCARAILEAAS